MSAVPRLDGGQPVASVTLMKGEEVKKVTENWTDAARTETHNWPTNKPRKPT